MTCEFQHGLGPDGQYLGHQADTLVSDTGGSEIIFHEMASGKFVPRSLLVDLEPGVVDEVKTGKSE